MKSITLKILTIIIALVSVSCATTGKDLIDSGDVTIETKDSENVRITNVYVQQKEDDLLIHADVIPKNKVRFFHPEHLHYKFSESSGNVFLDLKLSRYTQETHGKRDTKHKKASFWFRMPMNLPTGTKIHISHHDNHLDDTNLTIE